MTGECVCTRVECDTVTGECVCTRVECDTVTGECVCTHVECDTVTGECVCTRVLVHVCEDGWVWLTWRSAARTACSRVSDLTVHCAVWTSTTNILENIHTVQKQDSAITCYRICLS